MSESENAGRGIKAQLNRVVLIPAVTFLALFAVLSAATVSQALALRQASAEVDSGIRLHSALVLLQQERRAALEYLGAPSARALELLRERQAATDRALTGLEPAGGLSADLRAALADRGTLREDAAAARTSREDVRTRYSAVIDLGISDYAARGRRFQDGSAVAAAATVVQALRVQETFAHADALLSGAVAAGELSPSEQTVFAGLVDELRRRLAETGPALAPEAARQHAELTRAAEWSGALSTAEQIRAWKPLPPEPLREESGEDTGPAASFRALPPTAVDWRSDADAVDAALVSLANTQARTAVRAARTASTGMLSAAIGGSILVVFAGVLAYGIASRTAGRLTNRLSRLRRDTLDLAGRELPVIVQRLERGEHVDLRVQPRRLDYGADEIGQVADAFNTAQRTAVAAAVRQAEIREGANRVFLALAHRDQSLLQRQLNLLDRVEREEEDPDLLADLFQLDHLATRGRRNAENLIILAGGRPGRRWRNPIPLIDVLRSAISEIEEYPRVRVRPVPELAVRGEVVADVIHLLAELVENATAYSPPHAGVCVHTEVVPKGLVVEVEDRGLGISEEGLAEANETLSAAPEFDVMALNEDARLGLFVVARLAAKHGIGVRLRGSPYGGTRAIVLIPARLVVESARLVTLPPVPDTPEDLLAPPDPSALPASGPGAKDKGRSGEADNRSGPGRQEETAPPAEDGPRPRLPKRRRQTHIAPQLRDGPVTGPLDLGTPTGPRSPDRVRQMMSAFQKGTRRGRQSEPAAD